MEAVAAEPSNPSSSPVNPLVLDVLLAVTVAAVLAAIIATDQGGERSPDLVAYLFALGFGGLMLLRRHLPLGALALAVLGLFAYYTLGYPAIGVALPVAAALFATADAGRLGWAVLAGTAVCLVSLGFRLRDGEPVGYLLGYDLVSNVALIAAAVAIGDGVRAHRLQAGQQARLLGLTADQATHAAATRMQVEREAVSRDLHDSVGHTASVIAIQAGVAREALDRDPAAAADALDRIRAASGGLLTDLRAIVAVLRSDKPDRADRHHGPVTLGAIDDLVGSARAAGLHVDVHDDTQGTVLPPAVDTTAYRIVQEALTNTLRHAGAGRVVIRMAIRDAELHLLVRDDGQGRTPVGPPVGLHHGLAGMADRARLVGGSLVVDDAGGFAIRARLPLRPAL